MVITSVIIIIGLVILYWYYLTFNALISARTGVDQAWSNVEVQLKRRFDLIANLVSVAKGYASHEKSTLLETIQARTKGIDSSRAEKANQALPELNNSVFQLMAIAESYPDLKASEQFLTLQTELSDTENLIAERRHAYNQSVSLYQNLQLIFPSNLASMLGGFEKRIFFDAPDEVNQTPIVNLES